MTTPDPSLAIGSEPSESLRAAVRERYGAAARAAAGNARASCGCGSGCGCGAGGDSAGRDPVSADLYGAAESAGLPEKALLASLGCGNPTALAELHAGETV